MSGEKEKIGVEELKGYFKEEGIDHETSNMIINQLNEFIDEGDFDYKEFAGTIYWEQVSNNR